MQLPVRINEGDIVSVEYGQSEYLYSIEDIDENVVTITSLSDSRGTFDVDQYEIADMLNGGTTASIIR